MPEGPEVEVVTRQLRPLLQGARIVSARSRSERFLTPPLLMIRRLHRHGKWIVAALEDDGEPRGAMMINLGMSGRFVVDARRPAHVRWEVAVRPVDGGPVRVIRYVDPRGFGRLRIERGAFARELLGGAALARGAPLVGLGPDLMSLFMRTADLDARAARWRGRLDTSVPIKRALMDQGRLAGLGNIYASEACHVGRVHPQRPAREVTRAELARMVDVVPRMLMRAVAAGGTSFGDANSYRDSSGREGTNSNSLRVYGRAGQPCRCGARIVRTTDGGRSTFHCPSCQR